MRYVYLHYLYREFGLLSYFEEWLGFTCLPRIDMRRQMVQMRTRQDVMCAWETKGV